MKNAYLLVYSEEIGSRDRVKKWANESGLVTTWRYDLPNCFYIISENTAGELSEGFRKTFPKKRHIFIEVGANKQGWLPSKTWHLLNNKEHKKD